MSDEDRFVHAILETPEEDVPRLLFAGALHICVVFSDKDPQPIAPTTIEQLWPPKPKLFESARRTRISRAVFGT